MFSRPSTSPSKLIRARRRLQVENRPLHRAEIIALRRPEEALQIEGFADLPGKGRPLPAKSPGEKWDSALHMLRDAGVLPDGLQLRGELHARRMALRSWLISSMLSTEGGATPTRSRQLAEKSVADINLLNDARNLGVPLRTWQLASASIGRELSGNSP